MKTCESCNSRPAEVEFVIVSGSARNAISLCRDCAASAGMVPRLDALQRLAQLLLGQSKFAVDVPEPSAGRTVKCDDCSMTLDEFSKSGLLGCPQCYSSFQEALAPVLRRLHGVSRLSSSEHSENVSNPASARQFELDIKTRHELEIELQLALLEEDYEKAADLRDKIRAL